MPARACCMLDAIKKACYLQLKTPGNYRRFCPALLSILEASPEMVAEASCLLTAYHHNVALVKCNHLF